MTKAQERVALWVSIGVLVLGILGLALRLSSSYAALHRELGVVHAIATSTEARTTRIETLLLERKEAHHGGDATVQHGPRGDLERVVGVYAPDNGGRVPTAD